MNRLKIAVSFLCLVSVSAIADDATMLKVNDSKLHYVDTGNLDGPAIVLIHAFPLSSEMWKDQINILKTNFHVIAVDLRGLGKSDVGEEPYTMEFLVDDLFQIMDTLKLGKVIVAGLSMGGYVALRAIERNPDRFKGLILADTQSNADSDKAKLGRYSALKMIQREGLSAYASIFLKSALHKEISQRVKQIIESNTAKGVSSSILALISRTDTTSELDKIHIPALIMVGEYDSLTPLTVAQAMQAKIVGAKLVVIPDAGHLSNIENPEAFNTELVEFLNCFLL